MARSPTEDTLEELLPRLEREHDLEPDDEVRDAIWRLITAAEEYLLEQRNRRVKRFDGNAESSP